MSTNYSISNDNAVYLTGSLDNAKKWASMTDGRGKDYAVLRIDSSYLDPEKLDIDPNQALRAEDIDTSDMSDEEIREYLDIDFSDGTSYNYTDFAYYKNIPAAAIELVFTSDVSEINKAQELLDSHNFNQIFKYFDQYKDVELSTGMDTMTFAAEVAYLLNKEFVHSPDDLLKIPVNVLNTITDNNSFLKLVPTVLDRFLRYSSISKDLFGIAKVLSRIKGLSDHNIALFFKEYSKPKQVKDIDLIKTLPVEFLNCAKPYIAKKYLAILGI